MNKYFFILLSLIIANVATAQKREYYDMEPKHTLRKLRENKLSPKVYAVSMQKFNLTAKAKKRKVLNKDYAVLDTEIKSLMADSIKAEKAYQSKVRAFAEVSKIKTLIEGFLNSAKPYELKKEDLIEAQNLADAHGVKELIYADSNVNSSQKSKFFILQLNKLDLKVHLRKITWRLDQMDLVNPVKKPTSLLDQRLKDFRKRKNGIRKYNYITSTPKKVSKNKLAINNGTPRSLGDLSGKYTKGGLYHVVLSDYKLLFKKGMLITPEEAKKYKLEETGYVGPIQMLITEESTKKDFVTERTFLNAYAFSINGKFNSGKRTLVTAN